MRCDSSWNNLTKNAKFQQEVDYGYNINNVIVVPVDNSQEYTSFTDAIRRCRRWDKSPGRPTRSLNGTLPTRATVYDGGNNFKAFVAHVGGDAYMEAMGLD